MAAHNSDKTDSSDDFIASLFKEDDSFDLDAELAKLAKNSDAKLDELKKSFLEKYLPEQSAPKGKIEKEALASGLDSKKLPSLIKYLQDCGIKLYSGEEKPRDDTGEDLFSPEDQEESDESSLDFDDKELSSLLDEEKEADDEIQKQIDALVYAEKIAPELENYEAEKEKQVEDGLRWYLTNIQKYKPIKSSEEETEYFKRIELGDQSAKEEFICRNLRLVYSIAVRYSHFGMSLLDLLQEGNLGLCKAVDRFDYRMGNKFSTYATWWIRQAIARAIPDKGTVIRLPVHIYEKAMKVRLIKSHLEVSLNHEPTKEEISLASRGEFSPEKVEHLLLLLSNPISIDSEVPTPSDGSDQTYSLDKRNKLVASISSIPDEVANPLLFAERSLVSDYIEHILDQLTSREKQVICMCFGLYDYKAMTLEEAGKQLKVTRERVRQIEAHALRKLSRYSPPTFYKFYK